MSCYTRDDADVRADLLEMAEGMGWTLLPFKPGERAGGTEQMWRTFTATARPEVLRLAINAAWDAWVETELSPAWQRASDRWWRRFRAPLDLERERAQRLSCLPNGETP